LIEKALQDESFGYVSDIIKNLGIVDLKGRISPQPYKNYNIDTMENP